MAKHLPIVRLVQLSTEAVISDPDEAAHLRTCEHCRIILNRFVEDYRKQSEGKSGEGKTSKRA